MWKGEGFPSRRARRLREIDQSSRFSFLLCLRSLCYFSAFSALKILTFSSALSKKRNRAMICPAKGEET
jgi:hypothetical protein